MTPSVVFIGSAKHAVPAPHFWMAKAPSGPQMPTLPLTQAIWPALQADCSLREAKRVLKVLAEARLLAATSGEMVAEAAGVEVRIVGTWLLGVPVIWREVDEWGLVAVGRDVVAGSEEGVPGEG